MAFGAFGQSFGQEGASQGQIGGAIGGSALGAAGGVATGILQGIQVKQSGLSGAAGRKAKAQAGLNTAAAAASAAGPWGAVAGGVLSLVSQLLNIRGPRVKKQERAAARKREAAARENERMRGLLQSVSGPATLGGAQATRSIVGQGGGFSSQPAELDPPLVSDRQLLGL